MITIISYIGFLTGVLGLALFVYVSLLKIKLI